jgi:hypothetical protein
MLDTIIFYAIVVCSGVFVILVLSEPGITIHLMRWITRCIK